MDKINIFWFRRDLRVYDNKGFYDALNSDKEVQPIFIFDTEILDKLEANDPRVGFIHEQLEKLNKKFSEHNGALKVYHGKPTDVWKKIIQEFEVDIVFANEDYEPYARKRDDAIQLYLKENNIGFQLTKDQVIFKPGRIHKKDGLPYTVFTPYKNKWLENIDWQKALKPFPSEDLLENLYTAKHKFPTLQSLGFVENEIKVPNFDLSVVSDYDKNRNFPAIKGTSRLGPHLRFGTVSIRELSKKAYKENQVFLSELIWREFFMQILYHFPQVVNQSFKIQYDRIEWINDEEMFEAWCQGKTGYPMVDAGMRELNTTGFMHNRVRMVCASFLCKHLLTDWRWGEAYFATKLLDYELSANNGNWQWAAGTGCDAAPYFRVFNPEIQMKKFDPQLKYIRTWIEDFDELSYPQPIVEHKMARERAIETYKKGLEK